MLAAVGHPDREVFRMAVAQTVQQFVITTLFGFVSAALFVRTGHVLAPFVAHSFCNWMGVPGFDRAFKGLHKQGTRSVCVMTDVLYVMVLFSALADARCSAAPCVCGGPRFVCHPVCPAHDTGVVQLPVCRLVDECGLGCLLLVVWRGVYSVLCALRHSSVCPKNPANGERTMRYIKVGSALQKSDGLQQQGCLY